MMKGLICASIVMFISLRAEAQNDRQLKKITLNQIKELIQNSSALLGKTSEEIKKIPRPDFITDELNMWSIIQTHDSFPGTGGKYEFKEIISIHTGCGVLDLWISKKSNLAFEMCYTPVTELTKEKADNFLIKTFFLDRKGITYWGIQKKGTDVIIEFSTHENKSQLGSFFVLIKTQKDEKLQYYNN